MSVASQSTVDLAKLKLLIAKRSRHARELERIDRQMARSLSRLSAATSLPRFDFYERVRFTATAGMVRKLKSRTGYVLGRSVDDSGAWGYAVLIEGKDETWNFGEDQLSSTGEFAKREDFYDGSSVRVRVEKNGAGQIISNPGYRARKPRHKT
jgi:hypothetical protein